MSDRELWRSLQNGRPVARRTKAGAVVLLFGKHEGMTLEELPASYLRWMISAGRHLPEGLRAIAARLLPGKEGREIAEDLQREVRWRAHGHGYMVATRTADGPIILRFGKHEGTAIERVPDRYIQWMLRRGFAPQDLTTRLEAELRRRGAEVPGPERPDLPELGELLTWAKTAPAGEVEAVRKALRVLHDRLEAVLRRRADDLCRKIYE